MVLHWRNFLCYRARSRGKSVQKVSWTHKDPSTVALVGWKVVERWVCNEHGTIYAISSDFGDRLTTQHLD